MALNFQAKQAIVEEVSGVANQAVSAVTAEYRGLTVSALNELRSKARESNVYLRVIKNTLVKHAVKDTQFACLNDALVGPLLFAFSQGELGAAARLMRDFAKENKQLKVTALALDGQLLEANQLEAVAKLPTRDEAISMLMSAMQAPISKFVRTMAAPHTKLVRTVVAVQTQKEQAA